MRLLVWTSCLGLWLCCFVRFAGADTAFIEARLDDRTEDVTVQLEFLREELVAGGALGSPGEFARRMEEAGALPVRIDPGLRLDFADAIERSYKLWIAGKFSDCLATLQPLLINAHRNPADVAADSRLGASVYKGLVTLSLCQHRLGNERSSRDAMLELLRSFDIEVSKSQYGAEAVELFGRARAETKAKASGALTVKSRDESAAIFINERFAGVGKFSAAALIPGSYRVFAQVGTRQSRLHIIEIGSGENVSFELDAEREHRLSTFPWLGYSFEDREQRARLETPYAARWGVTVAVSAVIIIGLDERDGRKFAYGAVVDVVEGKELRRGSISMESTSSPQLQRALARFLMGEPPEAGILLAGAALPLEPESLTLNGRASPKRWSGWKWLAVGGAIGGLGAGTALLVLDGSCIETAPSGMKCPDLHDYKLSGVIALSAGVLMAGVATWLFVRERDDSRAAFWAVPSDGGAVAGMQGSW